MPTSNLFAFDAAGRVLVVVDAREVLVHDGDDQAPRWKLDLPDDPVGLGVTGDAVLTLDAAGKLSWWDVTHGAPLGSTDLGAAPRALAVAKNRAISAVILPDGVALVERGQAHRMLPLADATAAALTDDGARVAIASATGEMQILSVIGEPVGTSQLGAAVTSLCWSAAGFWVATSGDRVLRVAATGGDPEHITRARGNEVDCASASTDGGMFAFRLNDTTLMALTYPARETAVQLIYMDRKVSGVAFGNGPRLGVGLVGGDGNIADIPRGGLFRTDTFPGRTHNRWLVNMGIHPEVLPPEQRLAPEPVPQRPAAVVAAPAASGSTSTKKWALYAVALVVVIILASRYL